MAELTVIGWALSPLIDTIIAKTLPQLQCMLHWDSNMKKDLEKLQFYLIEIKTMVDACQSSGGGENLGPGAEWLRHLQDVVYDVEDLVDEIDYELLKKKVEGEGDSGKVKRMAKRPFVLGKRLIGLDGSQIKLTEFLEKVRNASASSNNLLQTVRTQNYLRQTECAPNQYASNSFLHPQNNSSRQTSSIPPAYHEFIGRKREMDEIINFLLRANDKPESSQGKSRPFSVITIVGVGGVGKTSLAQVIYNNFKVAQHFNLRKWVSVTDKFSIEDVTRKMLDNDFGAFRNFDYQHKKLEEIFEDKRFLLVLDVWVDEGKGKFDNKDSWSKLFRALVKAAHGSKILVTCRMEIVSKLLLAEKQINLSGLTDYECNFLLERCALGNNRPSNYGELKQITSEIASMLHGSPLAVKAAGSMLKDSQDSRHWEGILKQLLSIGIPDDIMPTLRLSYENLPKHLKPCFLYCSIFPKGWNFDPNDLVDQWIAQGYIQSRRNDKRRLVEIGMDYFYDLLSRSFFNTFRDESVSILMHELLHKLAISISEGGCLITGSGTEIVLSTHVQHLGIDFRDQDKLNENLVKLETNKLRKLRTLLCYPTDNARAQNRIQDMHVYQLERLRVLATGTIESISNMKLFSRLTLKHLRYLSLGGELPASLSKFYHLQVLTIYNNNCQVLPTLGHLPLLRKLVIKNMPEVEKIGLEFYGKNSGGLKGFPSLQELELHDMPKLAKWSGLDDQSFFPSLQQLVIMNCDKLMPLPWFPSTRAGLSINWNRGGEEHQVSIQGMPSRQRALYMCSSIIPSNIFLHRDYLHAIEKLEIKECKGNSIVALTQGISSLINLKDLIFCESELVAEQRIFELEGNLSDEETNALLPSSLEHLTFIDCHLTDTWLARLLHGSLASLTVCKITYCDILKSCRGLSVLPSIKELEVLSCELEISPPKERQPASLQSLTIGGWGLSLRYNMEQWLVWIQSLSSLSCLKITTCAWFESFESVHLHSITNVKKLVIDRCQRLTSIGGIHTLISLKELQVTRCGALKSLPPEGLPTSILSLQLYKCHPVLMRQLKKKQSPEWDRISHVPNISLSI